MPKNKRKEILATKAAARKENGNTSAKKKGKKENAKKKKEKKDSPERNARKKEFAAAKSDMKSKRDDLNKRLAAAGYPSLRELKKNTQIKDPQLARDVTNFFKEKNSSKRGKVSHRG